MKFPFVILSEKKKNKSARDNNETARLSFPILILCGCYYAKGECTQHTELATDIWWVEMRETCNWRNNFGTR